MSYLDNPRICAECGIDLFPNYMEGAWEHFKRNNGCRFDGKQAISLDTIQTNIEMLGPFKNEAT